MIVAVVLLVGVGISMSFLPLQRLEVPDSVRKPMRAKQINDLWPGRHQAEAVQQRGNLP